MPQQPAFVIVGASVAGAKAAETLRDEGFAGPVVLIGAEEERPYERPPLSKGYLLGKADKASLYVHDEHWYPSHDVDLRLGVTVSRIDPATRLVTLADGEAVGYGRLLLTTGAYPRPLDVPGHDLDGVHYLRTALDSEALATVLAPVPGEDTNVVILGAGWIGLEVAAAAREKGCGVTVLEPEPTRCTTSWARSWAGCSLTCTSPAGYSSGSASRPVSCVARLAGSPPWSPRPAPSSPPTWWSWPSARRPLPRWPKRRAWRWATACAWTPRCAAVTQTSSPRGTWPAWRTRCWAAGCGWSTGPTR